MDSLFTLHTSLFTLHSSLFTLHSTILILHSNPNFKSGRYGYFDDVTERFKADKTFPDSDMQDLQTLQSEWSHLHGENDYTFLLSMWVDKVVKHNNVLLAIRRP